MNGVGKFMIALFGGLGILMVLVGRELQDRGGELGDASRVFVMIGMIWTVVAIFLLVLFLLVGRGVARNASRQAELLRESSEGPDAA